MDIDNLFRAVLSSANFLHWSTSGCQTVKDKLYCAIMAHSLNFCSQTQSVKEIRELAVDVAPGNVVVCVCAEDFARQLCESCLCHANKCFFATCSIMKLLVANDAKTSSRLHQLAAPSAEPLSALSYLFKPCQAPLVFDFSFQSRHIFSWFGD